MIRTDALPYVPQGLEMTGFFGCLVFSSVFWMTKGRRRFDQLSLTRVGVWGAVAGALIVLGGVLIGLQPAFDALVLVPVTVTSAVSATGSLALARMANNRQLPDPGEGSGQRQLE